MITALKAAGGFACVACVFHSVAMLAVGGLSITVIAMAGSAAVALIVAVSKAEW